MILKIIELFYELFRSVDSCSLSRNSQSVCSSEFSSSCDMIHFQVCCCANDSLEFLFKFYFRCSKSDLPSPNFFYILFIKYLFDTVFLIFLSIM